MTNREFQYNKIAQAINRRKYIGMVVKPPDGISENRWSAMLNSVISGNFNPEHDLRANWKSWRYDYTLPA